MRRRAPCPVSAARPRPDGRSTIPSHANKSAAIYVAIAAEGGAGGANTGGTGGHGGAAAANANLKAAGSVNLAVSAYGGAGGTGTVAHGAGSAASANGVATGTAVTVTSSAYGGAGLGTASSGVAITQATGNSGSAQAYAEANGFAGNLVTHVGGTSATALYGTLSVKDTTLESVTATLGVATTAMDTTSQAVAHITGAPTAADISAVRSANTNINTAFNTPSPAFFALGELGGHYTSAGTGSETTTASLDLTVDLTKLATREHLIVGLFGGQSTGSGVTNVTFTITGNNTTLLSISFNSASAAVAYFHDDAIDLGALTAPIYNSGTLTLHASLSVTSSSVGSGFYGNLLIGDPPVDTTTAVAPEHHVTTDSNMADRLAMDAFSFANHGGTFVVPLNPSWVDSWTDASAWTNDGIWHHEVLAPWHDLLS